MRPLRTTTKTYSAHQGKILFDTLPKSFQDAVLVASHLGIARIWIDSLCIIQDSEADWETECPLMANIYSNALLTIAASDAPNSLTGFLHDYPSKDSCVLGDSVAIRYIRWGYSSRINNLYFADEKTMLSKRGWALQEAIFSNRLIAFKQGRMQWRCNAVLQSDDVRAAYPEDTVEGQRPTMGYLKSLKEKQRQEKLYGSWHRIVADFSMMKLTYPTDKLPALSGIAKVFSKILEDRYVAGL